MIELSKEMKTGILINSLDSKQDRFKFPGIDSIPYGPQIPLKNYLLDLVSDSGEKESSVYLKKVEGFIQEVWAEIVTNNWRTLRIRKLVPEKLGVHHIMLYSYKSGKKAISVQNLYKLLILWKEYCQKTDRDIQKKWDEIYESDFVFSVHKGLQPTKLPKYLTPKLSYLVGWICGDGHMTDYGNHYLIKISEKSLDELYLLRSLFKDLFGIDVPIFQIYEGGQAIQFGNKPIFRFLTRVLKVKVGEVPGFVKNLDPINKKHFLIGILDSEGSVDSSYLESRIIIHQASSKFLEEIIDLFKDIDIRFTGPYRHETKLGIWYHIQIRKKADISKFIKEISSCHIDKFQKIKILEKKLYAHGYCYNSA